MDKGYSAFRQIDYKLAINIMLVLLAAIILFHILILFQLLPWQIVWGGRLDNLHEMRLFEIISIMINVFIGIVIAIKGGYVRAILPAKTMSLALYVFVAIFILNTLGNIFSNSLLEAIIFTPVTFLGAVLCYRIAIEK
jgi:hypothetical protein